jgi:hypothetical protein
MERGRAVNVTRNFDILPSYTNIDETYQSNASPNKMKIEKP